MENCLKGGSFSHRTYPRAGDPGGLKECRLSQDGGVGGTCPQAGMLKGQDLGSLRGGGGGLELGGLLSTLHAELLGPAPQ